MRTAKAAPPETVAQAQGFDRVKARAVEFGLCHDCAAQLAWSHQAHTGGFGAARPPCSACAPLVALLPVPRANGWRTVEGAASKAENWSLKCAHGLGATVTPRDAVDACRSDPVPALRGV